MLCQGFSVILFFSLRQFYIIFVIKKMFYNVVHTSATDSCTLESRIIGRVRIGGLDIVIVINNRGGGGRGLE